MEMAHILSKLKCFLSIENMQQTAIFQAFPQTI